MKKTTLQNFKDEFSKKAFGRSQSEAAEKHVCVFCGKLVNPDEDFRDKLSQKEYFISRLCQECQDSVFGKNDK